MSPASTVLAAIPWKEILEAALTNLVKIFEAAFKAGFDVTPIAQRVIAFGTKVTAADKAAYIRDLKKMGLDPAKFPYKPL